MLKATIFFTGSDSSDEGVGMMSVDLDPRPSTNACRAYSTTMVQTDPSTSQPECQEKLWEIEILQRQLIEIRLALDRERRARLMFETQLRNAEINRLQVNLNFALDFARRHISFSLFQSLTRMTLEYPSPFHAASLLVPQTSSSPANAIPTPPPQAAAHSPGLLSPSTVPKYPAAAVQSASASIPLAGVPASLTAGQFFHSNSSKQSLEAIVEAIRHLEGDQLFVDVECRSNLQQAQNLLSQRNNQQNDSGISSPVSERPYHLPSGNDVANAVLQTFYQQVRLPGQ